ncbi:MAG: hypothetical protein AB8F95_15020 [Bacteroidia bacterium]
MKNALSRIYQANAIFSGLCGIYILIATRSLSAWMGLSGYEDFVWSIGPSLLAFAVFLIVVSLKQNIARYVVVGVVVMDSLWVIGSALIICFQLFNLSSQGYWLVGIIAIIVSSFGILGARHLSS